MIGKDESNEEVVFKVNDRRKFNADGSLREGVEIAPEKPKEESSTGNPQAASETFSLQSGEDAAQTFESSIADLESLSTPTAEEESDDDELPGAEDPTSFVNFLSTLATNAAAALGAIPHPATGQRTLDLDTGKYWIDVLSMLKDKTKNNLHPKEQELFDGILGDLKMQYVQVMRLAEEKLKQQAAQKFSANDILGRK